MNPKPSTLPDAQGERISAYLDGELPPHEAAQVERLLAEDPAARRFADELRAVSRVCQADPTPTFSGDLASSVVAEALRRQAAGEGAAELPGRLEPEGDFGLPFGKSSRTWAWAGVAVAAAVLISFYGRPSAQPGRPVIAQQPQQIDQGLAAMRQAVPGLQVVNYQATPEKLARLRRLLAMQSAQRAQLPGELMTVSQQQRGVAVEPIDPSAEAPEGVEQLVYVDADQAELDRLLAQVEGDSLKQVEPERQPTADTPAAPRVRAAPFRLQISPEQLAKIVAQQQGRSAPAAPGQKRVVVLRIKITPKAAD